MAVLGKVAMTAKGEWSNTVTYEKLDLVIQTEATQASLYIATDNITAGTALSNSKWQKLYTVKKGTNGTKGKNGTPGAKGDKGDKGEPGEKGDKGETGAKGADGKYITAIALTKDETGAITGGTATMSDETTVTITVS